jgi:hypothetical protein
MLRAIKKPRSFSGGASVQMMRSFDYARTAPEPPEGALVLAVRLVVVVMGRSLCGRPSSASMAFGGEIALNMVEQAALVTQ